MHASSILIVSTTTADRNWSLGVRGDRYVLSDDQRGKVYVGDRRGLQGHAPHDVLLALSVELAKAQRPIVKCAGCGSCYTRVEFAALPLIVERERIEIRICACGVTVAAPNARSVG